MIAIAKEHVDNAQDRFLAMLPRIEQVAEHAFRGARPEMRAELVQEVIDNCHMVFIRLVQLGKIGNAFGTLLANYGLRQVRAGRRVGTELSSGDVLSPANRRVCVEHLEQYDRQSEEWRESVVEDKHGRANRSHNGEPRASRAMKGGARPIGSTCKKTRKIAPELEGEQKAMDQERGSERKGI